MSLRLKSGQTGSSQIAVAAGLPHSRGLEPRAKGKEIKIPTKVLYGDLLRADLSQLVFGFGDTNPFYTINIFYLRDTRYFAGTQSYFWPSIGPY
jgi:hypothetical protein